MVRQPSETRRASAATLEAPREPSAEEIEFKNNPLRFLELARDWAAGGNSPMPEHELWLRELPVRRIRRPEEARAYLWDLLAHPERGRALTWLDSVGLLEEIVPIWFGDAKLRALRLRAVEEVHIERWAETLSKKALGRLNRAMDERTDGGLSGWGLTALATLLLESNGYTERYGERLNEELKELGATDAERMKILTAIIEYPFLQIALTQTNESNEQKFSPVTIVAALSTLYADDRMAHDVRVKAGQRADQLLAR